MATFAFVGLLVATGAAFFLSSILKNQPSVLENIERLKFFSPNGDGNRDVQVVSFSLDESAEISVDVVDPDGGRVRRVVERRDVRRGRRITVRWDGREDDGRRAPDGEYSIRVILRGEGRAILAPRPFEVDTKPLEPVVTVAEDAQLVRPGEAVAFTARRIGELEPPIFTVLRTDRPGEPQAVRTIDGEPAREDYTWDGRDDEGDPVDPGTYLIRVRASDPAGNVADRPRLPLDGRRVQGRPGVTVRELVVQPPVTPARSGALAAFNVDARERPYRWELRRVGDPKVLRKGKKAAGRSRLLVKLPFGPSGVLLLRVRAGDDVSTVPLAVQARVRKPLLLVLPVISWLGQDPIDAQGDGVVDTFATGAAVAYPRPFAFPGGLPTGIARDIGPLLAFLDEAKVNYDLTTDLAFTRDEQPADDREGVLFLGSPQWIGADVGERLRDYVRGGGKVALFGPRALRSSVTVTPRELRNATPPTPEDALGARIADPQDVDPGAPLSVLAEDSDLGLLEGFAGQLPGFSEVEELLGPGEDGEVRTSIGRQTTDLRPAFSAVGLGDGLVIRIGLPEWVQRLGEGDDNVRQLTFNVIDVLRGARPRVRGAN